MATNANWMTLSAACLLTSVPAVSSESLLAAVRSCAAQADDSARLQCYDRGVAQFKGKDDGVDAGCLNTGFSQPAVSSKSTATTGVTAEPNAQSTDQFGLTSGQILLNESNGKRAPVPKQLTARIATLSHRPGGALVLHLDNGQVWEQTEDGPDLKIAAGSEVTIDRGVLGAYFLSGRSKRAAVKVRRIQ